ncbi:MAG: FAD-dependent oxidoreductase, partial [Rikenella sp.]|nr:FAD-dependent oxidoreductase [Rikenella sp.]
FPSFTPAAEVLSELRRRLRERGIAVRTRATATEIGPRKVVLDSGEELSCDAVVLASGFTLFDASVKEEYGYGMYENVITSAELEGMFREGRVAMRSGEAPKRVAILHCVGSRDEKVGQNHCSKVCCITGIKQAIELAEALPGVQVTNFYMDLRAFGNGYEELYRRSQIEHGVTYIRGRISEAGETQDKRIQLKVEDTLVGRPLRMTVDMLVLLVGMRAPGCCSTFGLSQQANGFFAPRNPYTETVRSSLPGVYLAGAATGPKTIAETLNEAIAAARQVKLDLTR